MPKTLPKIGKPGFKAPAALDGVVVAEVAALVWELIVEERLLASEDVAEWAVLTTLVALAATVLDVALVAGGINGRPPIIQPVE